MNIKTATVYRRTARLSDIDEKYRLDYVAHLKPGDVVGVYDDMAAEMIRRVARADRNQREIVQGLRRSGASVQVVSMVGSGFPDLVIGAYGGNSLVEIKDGRKCPSERKLTADQVEFRQSWKGRIVTVETLEQALDEVEHWRRVALALRGMR